MRRSSATAVPSNIRKSDDERGVSVLDFLRQLPADMLTGNPQWKQNGSSGMGLPQIGQWEITLQMLAVQAFIISVWL
jgi:hypothetical protein